MSSIAEPPKPPKKPSQPPSKPKRPAKGIAEKLIDWKQTNDVARRFALTLEILDCLGGHSVHEDSDEAENTAESTSVLIATCAYLVQSYGVSEKDAVDSYRRMFKLMRSTEKHLAKKIKRVTARDVFAEVALTAAED